MSAINPTPEPNPWEAAIINTPQPIKIVDKGEFIELYKQDVRIDSIVKSPEILYALTKFLMGAVKVGAVHGELEQMKDILSEYTREANAS